MARRRLQFLLPTLLLGVAGALLMTSVFLPYWNVELETPQYSMPLEVHVYLQHLEGDVHEIEALRHLLPVDPLPARGMLERSLAAAMVVVMALLAVAAIYIHNRWAAWLSLPGALFPFAFYGDFRAWLIELETAAQQTAGMAVASAPGPGWIVALLASVMILVGLAFHRRAYRPLFHDRA